MQKINIYVLGHHLSNDNHDGGYYSQYNQDQK